MSNKENHVWTFLKGLITGGILGGLAGLLLAPKSGKKFRRDISNKANDIIDEANQQLKNTGEIASNIISDAKKKAENLIDDGKKKVEAVAKASENIYKNSKDIIEEKVSKYKDIF